MWRFPAVSLNFRPQQEHWIMSSWPMFFSSAVSCSPLPAFSPARNAALCCFHFGIFSAFSAFSGCFFLPSALAGGGGGGGGCLKSSTSGCRNAAELKAFRFDWNTFSQTFSCLGSTSGLKFLPHPLEQGTSSTSSASSQEGAFLAAGLLWAEGGFLLFSFAISRSRMAMKSWLLLRGTSSISLTYSSRCGREFCFLMGLSSMDLLEGGGVRLSSLCGGFSVGLGVGRLGSRTTSSSAGTYCVFLGGSSSSLRSGCIFSRLMPLRLIFFLRSCSPCLASMILLLVMFSSTLQFIFCVEPARGGSWGLGGSGFFCPQQVFSKVSAGLACS